MIRRIFSPQVIFFAKKPLPWLSHLPIHENPANLVCYSRVFSSSYPSLQILSSQKTLTPTLSSSNSWKSHKSCTLIQGFFLFLPFPSNSFTRKNHYPDSLTSQFMKIPQISCVNTGFFPSCRNKIKILSKNNRERRNTLKKPWRLKKQVIRGYLYTSCLQMHLQQVL